MAKKRLFGDVPEEVIAIFDERRGVSKNKQKGLLLSAYVLVAERHPDELVSEFKRLVVADAMGEMQEYLGETTPRPQQREVVARGSRRKKNNGDAEKAG